MTGHRQDGGEPSRRPRRVYAEGAEPDPRFSLANERTALAWMRTSLAFVAGGVGLATLVSLAVLPGVVVGAAAAACLTGGGLAVRAVRGWARVECALRRGEPLPAPHGLYVLALFVVVLALLLSGALLRDALS
jgi:putative membrane protein